MKSKRPYIERGGSVLVKGIWYPIDGFVLTHHALGNITGHVFTLKPNGRPFEPCLGYRIEYEEIEAVATEK